MLHIIDLLLLSLSLTLVYAALGVLSLAFERGPALLRRSRRARPQTWQRVRRRPARPRHRPGAVSAPRPHRVAAAVAQA